MTKSKYTRKQFLAWLETQRGWGDDMLADYGPDADLETAAFETATNLIQFPDLDEGGPPAITFLRSTRVSDLVGCLADYLHDVAHSKETK